MRVIIIEDEYMIAQRLKRMVETALADKITSLQLFDCLDDAREHTQSSPIDVMFLDLNLNGKNGFELLNEHISQSFHTIVVSANSDRAIEAFDIGVLDFVAKPFTQERINKAVQRLMDRNATGTSKVISYRHLGKLNLLSVEDILYLHAAGHYCEITTVSGQQILHDKSLERLLNILPDSFYRIHRSYAVPLSRVSKLIAQEGSKYWAELPDGTRLPVGRTKIKTLKSML